MYFIAQKYHKNVKKALTMTTIKLTLPDDSDTEFKFRQIKSIIKATTWQEFPDKLITFFKSKNLLV